MNVPGAIKKEPELGELVARLRKEALIRSLARNQGHYDVALVAHLAGLPRPMREEVFAYAGQIYGKGVEVGLISDVLVKMRVPSRPEDAPSPQHRVLVNTGYRS